MHCARSLGHGADAVLARPGGGRQLHLVGDHHPGQGNMSTRTLTPSMLRDVLRRGAETVGLPARSHGRAGI